MKARREAAFVHSVQVDWIGNLSKIEDQVTRRKEGRKNEFSIVST